VCVWGEGALLQMCLYACECICVHVCACMCMGTCVSICECTCTCVYVSMCVGSCVPTCTSMEVFCVSQEPLEGLNRPPTLLPQIPLGHRCRAVGGNGMEAGDQRDRSGGGKKWMG
jgi:hypothetical protein